MSPQFLTRLPSSPACADFTEFATQGKVDPRYIGGDRKPLAPFRTDSIVVVKDGQFALEWYDGVKTERSSHVLWSASKMITGTLIGRTINDGYTYQGRAVTLETPLSVFYPNEDVLRRHPERRARYEKITLRNLVEMSANFDWKEFYDDDMSNSSFLPMLYLQGRRNMPEFALAQPLNPRGPGEGWSYSGGNVNILMGVLGKIHSQNRIDGANDFPKRLLFDELGLTGARVEQDQSGNYVGSSYVYMTTRDMAKIGQLYLHGGFLNGKRLLPQGWTDEAQELTPVVFKQETSRDYIAKLGAQSKRVFWLNKDIYRDDGKLIEDGTGRRILYPREMPEAPNDLYFAAGHYGQLIVVVPSQNLIIARTGYDIKYWDHVQPLVVKALSCLNPAYRPNPVLSLVPPSADPEKGSFGKIFDFIKSTPRLLKTLAYSRQRGLAASTIAKELCSFSYVSGAAETIPEQERKDVYFSRSGLPAFAMKAMTSDLDVEVDDRKRAVTVRQFESQTESPWELSTFRKQVREVKAQLMPDSRMGCRLQ